MKPFSMHPGSCSCISCVYRSRSKTPKVQSIIQGGTEIDKLYYGKFLPLRERKLLEKLIRTRDVYDDVRTQLLSSASSDQISQEHKKKRRDDVSTDKSSVLLKVVDFVDRGQMRSENTSKLNSCCSCCSCETLKKIRKRMEKEKHKYPRAYRHIVACEDIAKYCAEAEERGRKRRNKLSTKISSTLSSKTRAGRLKIKKNLSEPCACTLSLSSMAPRSSRALKKMRSKKKNRKSAQDRKVVTINQETKMARLPRKPRKKVKNIQSSTTKDIGTEVRRLKAYKIKKDSILLFKEKLLKKRTYEENQDVECEPGTCNTDECIPEECLRKIKAKGVGDTRKRKYHTRLSETRRDRSHVSMSFRSKKVKVKDSQVQEGPSPKSSYSMTTILKTKIVPSFSKSEIKGKRSVSPKQRHQFEKGTGKQERAHIKTKSATSMTSIPKSKAKAQLTIKEEEVTPIVKPKAKLRIAVTDKRLEDKGIGVQVSRQSNLVICECKLSTKSTSSLTSLPKQKASKSRSKRIESHEIDSPPTRHKRASQKHRRESYQNLEEADLEEPIELIKVEREKRMRPTHGTAQILLSRSKSRGKSTMMGMDRLRRKSVGSAAFSQKTSQKKTGSRSRTKSKHNHSKSAENFIIEPKYVSKEPIPQTVEKYSPDRQAVKITSSFSFDIEFYKDTYPSLKDNEKKDLVSGHRTHKIKQKEHRRKYKAHGTRYINSQKNISSQSRSSQSFKNIQVGYRLKRCFCTLKLLPKQKRKLKHSVSKRTITSFHNKELDMGPRKKRTQTKHSGIVYVVPPATSTQTSLLPYNCETYFCTPGECNSYECAERIKQRYRGATRHVSKDTNTTITPKKSKLASTPQSASKSTFIHSPLSKVERKVSGDKSERHGNRNIKHKGRLSPLSKVERKVSGEKSERHGNRNIKHKRRLSPLSKVEHKVSGDKSERHGNRNVKHKDRHSPSSKVERTVSGDYKSEKQAVRIGSNFNFEIEFSKININDQEREDTLKYGKLIKRGRKDLQEKGKKVYKPHVRHETSETNKYTKTKKTYTEPFLQRCLCTLRLLKKNKKKAETLSPWRNRNEYVMHMQNNSVTTNRAEIRYNPERSKLSSYEWEPNLCIPKECDPYNCKQLINLRHLKLHHKYSNILSGDLRSRSTLISKTSTIVTSKSRNTQSFTKKCPRIEKKRNDYSDINSMPSCSKQRVMRIASKSSLKMSYYKSKHKFITTEDLINKHTHSNTQHKHNKDNLNTIGSRQFKRPAHISIDAEAKLKEKESYIFSAIKRCFSTFKFQKKKKKLRLNDNDVINEKIKTPYPLPNSQISEYKSNLTRLSKLPYNWSSHKYAPNFYIPGMCDPYDCYEEKQRHEVKGLHDHYVSTDRRERKSVMSVTTSDFSGSTMARSTQSRMLKRKKNKGQNVRDKQRDIKDARSFSPSLQAAHKGSLFSFNNEIPKYCFVPIRDTSIKNYNTVNKISAVSRVSDKSTKNKQVTLENDLSQANDIRKETKASNVGFLLKRCFCTLGLQKKNKKKPEFRWHPPVTTQFVQVEQNRHDKKKSGCNVLNKTLYGGEPLKLKLPEGDHLIRDNPIGNQSAKHLRNSRSFSRRSHVRSRIEINFGKMRNLLNTQKINPFYRSFYALNVKVSKSKNMSHNKYSALNHNERKLYECPSNECQPNKCYPVDCIKKIKQLKRSNLDSQLSGGKGSYKPMTFGSDFIIKAGVYKDTDPYKCPCRRAFRLGSNVGLNFDFFKEPSSRGFFHTGPTSNYDRKGGRRSQPRPTDSQVYGETQNHPKYKSTTRLSPIRERRTSNLKTKSFQYKDYSQQQRKKCHRPTSRNNVTFCTNVDCVEFYNDRTPKQNKLNQEQRRGEGDVETQKGLIGKCVCEKENKKKKLKCLCAKEDKKKKLKCLCAQEDKKKKLKCFCAHEDNKKKLKCFCAHEDKKKKLKCICAQEDKKKKLKCICVKENKKNKCFCEKEDSKNKLNKFIGKCYCTLKYLKGQNNGKHLTPKESMEMIGRGKQRCKQLDEAKKEMETIMPYSEKKFKNLDSQTKLAQCTNDNTQLIMPDSKKKNKKYFQDINLITTLYRQRVKPSPKNKTLKLDDESERAPVTNILPCPCKGQDLGKKICVKKRKQQMPERPVVDDTPLFEMTVNKANMNIINRNEVLQNLGSSGKESKAMKKARAAIKKGTMGAPVMEVVIDTENASIINSDQVMKQINGPIKEKKGKIIKAKKRIKAPEQTGKKTKGPKQNGSKRKAYPLLTMGSVKKQLSAAAKSHDSKCKCCICRGSKKGKKPPEDQFFKQPRKLKPCICGSIRCKEDWYKLKREERNLKIKENLLIKKCICGSYLCDEESQKRPEVLLEAAKNAEHKKDLAKLAKIKDKLYQKERKKRAKEYQVSFNKQLKLRSKEDRRKMRSIEKQKNVGDISMIAESLIDLGSFGSKAFCDIAGSLFQAVKYPRDAINDVRDAIKKPGGAAKTLRKTVAGMGLFSTLERIKERLVKMPTAKLAVATLETFPATNYLIHMADKDPKKRMKKFKAKRMKEQTEFKCSLYMASMRKRPCLRVYRMCPWFYPHCMSLLNVWKQLTDILLFLLAVAVWSPCILCMELLRGCVCCCMCQG